MPWILTKTGVPNEYGVRNAITGQWKSYNTTKKKATRQLHLLEGVMHGWHPHSGRGSLTF